MSASYNRCWRHWKTSCDWKTVGAHQLLKSSLVNVKYAGRSFPVSLGKFQVNALWEKPWHVMLYLVLSFLLVSDTRCYQLQPDPLTRRYPAHNTFSMRRHARTSKKPVWMSGSSATAPGMTPGDGAPPGEDALGRVTFELRPWNPASEPNSQSTQKDRHGNCRGVGTLRLIACVLWLGRSLPGSDFLAIVFGGDIGRRWM